MKITLRKANTIQASILEAIKSISVSSTIDLNEFQNPIEEITAANSLLFENDRRRQALLFAMYNIRGLIGQANAVSNVDINLTKIAYIDKRVEMLTALITDEPMLAMNVIQGKIEKIKTSPVDSYRSDQTVTTSVISAEQLLQIQTEIKSLKKQKQQLNDLILEINIKTEVPLTDEVVATLTKEEII